jgi:hypothetical protein
MAVGLSSVAWVKNAPPAEIEFHFIANSVRFQDGETWNRQEY